MNLTSRDTITARIVTVNADRIDAAVAIQFKEDMRHRTNGSDGRVVLDLSDVNFIDSSGLGAIVAAMKQLGPGRSLALAGLQPNVEKVFRLTRMDTVFPLHLTLNDALGGQAD